MWKNLICQLMTKKKINNFLPQRKVGVETSSDSISQGKVPKSLINSPLFRVKKKKKDFNEFFL